MYINFVDFSSAYCGTNQFFNFSNRAWVLARSSSLIIHIQMGKLHFGPHDKNEEEKRKEAFLTYKKL